jgi:hypothetical protein
MNLFALLYEFSILFLELDDGDEHRCGIANIQTAASIRFRDSS